MERVWIRHGDDCARFKLVNGKLDLGRITNFWELDPLRLSVAHNPLTYDSETGFSAESIDEIREWVSEDDGDDEQDGKHRKTALVLSGASATSGGISAAELRAALDAMRADIREMKSEASRTRSASRISVGDFQMLREGLKVVVAYEDKDGNIVDEDVLKQLVGDDEYWNQLYDRQQKSRYIEKLKEWVPEDDRIRWKDADGRIIYRKFASGMFPVSGENDQVACLRGRSMEQAAMLAVELRRKTITMKGLRQAEVEFYLWGDASLLPFVQLITDMQKGGVAMYCRSRAPDRIELVQVVLRNMGEVESFVKQVLARPPSADALRYSEEPLESFEPTRKKFKPLKEEQRGTGPVVERGTGPVLEHPWAEQQRTGPVLEHPSPAQLLLWTLGPKLLADENDVANMADLQCFDIS